MGRMDYNGSDTVTMRISPFLGLNTAVQFSQININQSPSMDNLLPGTTGSLANRKGTVPFTTTAQAGLMRVFPYRASSTDNIVASGGTTLYKLTGTTWTGQTMTNSLATANINAVPYRNDTGSEVLVIADGGNLKAYNGTAVANITPAANDTSPLPANALSTINTNNPAVGITTHNNRLVIWPLNKDIIYHSKPGFFDYFPLTSFQRFVVDNDYIQTCKSFGSSLLVFMRKHIGVLFGDGYSTTPVATDWSQDFLDTSEGCANPRSVQIVVFPDNHEEVFYQTDFGVSSVINVDTKSLDNSTRLATRNVTEDKVDWKSLGITNSEWANAVSYFAEGKYWLIFKQGSAYKGLVYDPNENEWFPVSNIRARDFYGDVNGFYFLGDGTIDGHLTVFDNVDYDTPSAVTSIVQDYDNALKTVGTPVSWYWYSKLLNPVLTGFPHLWDILMVECRQFATNSTIDVEVNGLSGQYQVNKAIKSAFMIVGFSIIGEAEIANFNFTEFINNAKRLRVFLKSQYIQIKLSNSVGNPVELFNVAIEVRPQVTYAG